MAKVKYPYASIEHRVIDSAAYASLTFSARSLLVLMTRQLTKDNNGHLQATYSYMRRFGFSVNTLSRAIRQLIAHGMIYRSRSGGYQKGAAQYAVTWKSITKREGLFLNGFQPCAWRNWIPTEKKTRAPKMRSISIKNGEWGKPTTPKSDARYPPKIEHNELIPICSVFIGRMDSEIKTSSTIRFPQIANGRLPQINQHFA